MLLKTFEKIKDLNKDTQNLMFAFWLFDFGQNITKLFLNVFVYLKTESFLFLIIFNAIFFTGCLFGFVIVGYLVAQLRVLMRYHFLVSFAVFFLSFILLTFSQDSNAILLLFAFLNGLGLGMFWVGMHSFEMVYTHNSSRDFYSSMRTVGSQIITILAPLFATFSFIISEKYLKIDSFKLLFIILPSLFVFALPFVFKMSDFLPEKIEWSRVKNLLIKKKSNQIRLMYLFDSVEWVSLTILIPFIALYSLKTVVNIGFFEALIGIISIIATIILSHLRNSENRSTHLFYGVIGLFFAYSLLFWFDLSIYVYIVYSLTRLFFNPIWNIPLHSIHLASVEYLKQTDDSCFYAELLYRDFMLWVGRIINVFVIGLIFYFVQSDVVAVKASLILLLFLLLLKWYFARKVDVLIK